jgi:hypothetical protein
VTLALATGALTAFAFVVNLPFGWWRAGLLKLSPAWFVAVHAAVPLVIGARLALGLPFRWLFVPLYAAAYFSGQALGARLRARTARGS